MKKECPVCKKNISKPYFNTHIYKHMQKGHQILSDVIINGGIKPKKKCLPFE